MEEFTADLKKCVWKSIWTQKITDLKKPDPSIKKVLLSLGSNIEPREKYIQKVYQQIQKDSYCKIIQTSTILDNPAILFPDQPDFLNQIIEIETLLSPFELLYYIKDLEILIGRKKRFRYGPREIDIDILFYENYMLQSRELTIPHPGVYDRPYLKILLKEFDLTPYGYVP